MAKVIKVYFLFLVFLFITGCDSNKDKINSSELVAEEKGSAEVAEMLYSSQQLDSCLIDHFNSKGVDIVREISLVDSVLIAKEYLKDLSVTEYSKFFKLLSDGLIIEFGISEHLLKRMEDLSADLTQIIGCANDNMEKYGEQYLGFFSGKYLFTEIGGTTKLYMGYDTKPMFYKAWKVSESCSDIDLTGKLLMYIGLNLNAKFVNGAMYEQVIIE